MRYLLITYITKPNKQIDEVISIVKNIKTRDIQTCNVILDFKLQRVEKCTMDGVVAPKDWDRIVSYYYQHYANIIERLFEENGHPVKIQVENTVENKAN
jgi:hypothetical protein